MTISSTRDISFLYDAKVIDNRSKPLTSLSKSREVKSDTNKMGDLGMKTPGIEVTLVVNTSFYFKESLKRVVVCVQKVRIVK